MNKPALILSHGQPSDPGPAESELAELGCAVAAHCPDRPILTATLADPDRLQRVLAEAGPRGSVFPLFMAGGWFTRVHLPARLAAAGAPAWQLLEPLGCLDALHELALTIAAENPAPQLILAAHGSGRSRVPGQIAETLARRITARTGRDCRAAFIDQTPRLAELTGLADDSLCLPFFAAAGEHVQRDLPQALAEAGFRGRILPAIGLDRRLPALIARAIQSPAPICAAACRWQDPDGPA